MRECECMCYNKGLTDEDVELIKLIEVFVEEINEADNCPNCIFNILMAVFEVGEEIGYQNGIQSVRAFIEEIE